MLAPWGNIGENSKQLNKHKVIQGYKLTLLAEISGIILGIMNIFKEYNK